ncbi:MAG: DEAD/DEAH box helicase [Thermoplasmatota archaeon]
MNTSVFTLLHPRIQDLLREKQIFFPTEPQEQGIPEILNGKHVLLIAPTGHGKTESAILPLFHHLLQSKTKDNTSKEKGISILYITPLRALNRDMLRRTIIWGSFLGIDIAVRHGDTSEKERARQSSNPPDMLITTPETFQILFVGKRLRNHLKHVHWVVIDEIHELAHDERGAQLAVGLERLEEMTAVADHSFQRIGLSATVGDTSEVGRFLGGLQKNDMFRPVKILEIDATKHMQLSVEKATVENEDYVQAARFSMEPGSFAALRRCKTLIDMHVSTLLFINTRDGAEILSSRLHQWQPEFNVGIHHGSLSKNARIESEDQFKSGALKALICTSSLELGIDVGSTDFIIQYNSPREVTRIVQRLGRSGHRIGETSKGLILATSTEDLAESLVIARKTLHGELEIFSVRQNPLSVLSNQIISIALSEGSIHRDQLFRILKRAYPFYTLKIERFYQMVDQLGDQRSIWIEGEYIGKRRDSRNYFLDNISMIPDEITYQAIDIVSRKSIGKLDESFVLNSGFEGARFILQGRPWIIVKREEDHLLISQTKELGEIPSWSGEDIPVPFSVAMEVGLLRRKIASGESISEYPCDTETIKELTSQIMAQKDAGFVVPDDRTVTLEVGERTIILNMCCGTKVNETIGRVISALLSQSIGESVGINNDPYRIQLELPYRIPPDRIKDILLSVNPESLWYLLQSMLRNSTYVRWQLVHAARKFGALRKDFDYKNVGIKKLFTLFEHTPILEEAIDKLIWERMDIEHAQQILMKLQNRELLIVTQRFSPIGLAGVEAMRGLMVPIRADRTILKALQKRLEETRVALICVNCKNLWHVHVHNAPVHPQCPRCNAIKIAVFPSHREDETKVLWKKNLTVEEQRNVRRIAKNASLVLSYGKPAIIALMGRGIGPDTASRILRKYDFIELSQSEETMMKFLQDIHKAEIQYARTRGFWDA